MIFIGQLNIANTLSFNYQCFLPLLTVLHFVISISIRIEVEMLANREIIAGQYFFICNKGKEVTLSRIKQVFEEMDNNLKLRTL